jgi:hypothetical protein
MPQVSDMHHGLGTGLTDCPGREVTVLQVVTRPVYFGFLQRTRDILV